MRTAIVIRSMIPGADALPLAATGGAFRQTYEADPAIDVCNLADPYPAVDEVPKETTIASNTQQLANLSDLPSRNMSDL